MIKTLSIIAAAFVVAAVAFADDATVGSRAPSFALMNTVDGKPVAFKSGSGKPSGVFFTCNQCPYAKAFEPRLIAIAKEYQAKGVNFYAIDSNDEARYAEESAANMKARAVEKGYPYPYLKDADSSVARAYGAKVTPDVFVVDGSGVIRYRGYVDDSAKPEERKTTGLTDALDAVLAGKPVANASTRAFGCTIKFKS